MNAQIALALAQQTSELRPIFVKGIEKDLTGPGADLADQLEGILRVCLAEKGGG